ncbi:MAG: bifunctional folylpolyglutamate synthase/dihydrofolate synthase [Opitutales bacterium]|nr:bifunctional folylpolyglutamate synthase/dihydrofolate synthase [Opitutales bacterium]
MQGAVIDLGNYAAVKQYLYSLKYHGAKYGIDRMALLADALGHPERAFPLIHVAGTNGKGSTCAMLEAIYRSAGYRTGLFTSPHLVQLGERIQIDRHILSQDEILAYVRMLKPVAEKLGAVNPDDHPSFFEFLTAMGFLTFAKENVGVGLVEVGLGGRLDATNIVLPELAIITSIGLDHTEILGDTLEDIAFEKAGIIKAGRPVLIGLLPEAAERVIRKIAEDRGSRLYSVREEFGSDDALFPVTNLIGHHQKRNAATATLAARILRDTLPVDEVAVARALKGVIWAGRWDERTLPDGREIIFDATHNEEGAEMLEANLAKLVSDKGRKPVIICGALGQKRAHAVLEVVARHAAEIILMRPAQQRACTLEELEREVPKSFTGHVIKAEVHEIIPQPMQCRAGDGNETIVATGSIYLLGELMEALYHEVPVNEQNLQDGPGCQRLAR